MSVPVYRRGPRQFYGVKKTHGFIGTLQTVVFGKPVCDPRIIETTVQAFAAELALLGTARDTSGEGTARELVTAGTASDTTGQGTVKEVCST